MKLIIFSGFLGSGKTSIILSLAKEITQNDHMVKKRLVILENEIGETGIDDKILNCKGYQVKALLSGCICCTLRVELIDAINQIVKDIFPEYIIFEPSGIANPENIVDSVKKYVYEVDDIKVITVVDASRWNILMKVTPNLICNQVKSANVILINKCDLKSLEEINCIEAQLNKLNQNAAIKRVVAQAGVNSLIWKKVLYI